MTKEIIGFGPGGDVEELGLWPEDVLDIAATMEEILKQAEVISTYKCIDN